MKRTVRIAVAAILVVLIAATAATLYFLRVVGTEGTTPLEAWIGGQLKSVAQSHLNVTIDFDKPDYQYPATIVVENIRLSAPDPASPGKAIDIIRIAKATLIVAQIPEVGQPLHVQRIILDSPQFSFICTSKDDATLIGFSNLVKTDSTAPAVEPDPDLPASPAKVTDVFRMRTLHITGGQIFYDPRDPDERAMTLDGINMALNVEPDAEGWYKLQTKIDRLPVGEIDMNGRFNLNDNELDLTELKMMVNLGGENNAKLPPQMQRFLADHDLRGRLSATAGGRIRFADWRSAALNLSVNLEDGNITFGDYQLPIAQLSILAAMAKEQIILRGFDLRALGGGLRASGHMKLNETLDASITVEGESLRIHRLLKASADGQGQAEGLPFRGVATLKVNLTGPLATPATQMAGSGQLILKEARLLNIPGLSAIEDAIAGTNKANAKRKEPGANDYLYMLVTFRGDRMLVDRFDYRSTLVAVRATGHLVLPTLMMDLMANGGPIEKVQSLLGPVGDLTALVTDRVAKYHITGRVGEPKVKTIIAEGIFDKIFGN